MKTQKFIYAGKAEGSMNWRFIPDTDEAKAKAVEDGCNAFGTTLFDYAPEIKGKPEPTRYGPLWLDIDCKGSPQKAIVAARDLVKRLCFRYGVDLYSLRYFLSGSKGVHIEIPPVVYGGAEGHPLLPVIHKKMLSFALWLTPNELERSMLDMNLYCMGKGKLLRAPNILRADGNYKVQISFDEFMHGKLDDIMPLVKAPRDVANIEVAAPKESAMHILYDAAKSMLTVPFLKHNSRSALDALLECDFIQHCYTHQESLSEPEWFRMVGILMACGEAARPLVHEFSMGHPGYSFEETEKKIIYAKNSTARITCDYIREVYPCAKNNCGVRSPIDRFVKNKIQRVIAASAFSLKPDGVYYSASGGEEDDGFRLCSPMKILGKMRNPDGVSWSRLVEFAAPDGKNKTLCIPMRDCTGRGDTVRALLSDHGLEIAMPPKTNTLLMEYIQYGGPEDTLFLQLEKVGWHGSTYVLPDAQFGETLQEKIYFEAAADTLHRQQGSLEEWQEHVGNYCQGNSLLVLGVSYALTGPLLRLCDMEGGGLHVHGSSSTGKTTLALVAGSVCGGGGNRGFIRQWRSTHNALENTAAMHNDNLLVLDEVGQATAEAVSQVSYMLPNGQAKSRMKSDATPRTPLTWRLNFLSTGELTINDKIEETGKLKSMAGQVVRIIDLPVDAGSGRNLFQNPHDQPDAATLSNTLAGASLAFYGTPLRMFLERLCQDSETTKQRIQRALEAFVRENVPADASGQVIRVARKFGLLAIAGELAIDWGVFNFNTGEAHAAAKEWFAIWLEQRGGYGDVEMEKVLKHIQDHFSVERSRYASVNAENGYHPTRLAGYTWNRHGTAVYLMLSPVFDELTKGVNRKLLRQKMQKKGWIVCNSNGGLMETKSVDGRNVRGVVFAPSAWEGTPESPSQTQPPKHDDLELY